MKGRGASGGPSNRTAFLLSAVTFGVDIRFHWTQGFSYLKKHLNCD